MNQSVHICKGCNGYGFLKSMSVCRCCYGSGTETVEVEEHKDLSEKVKDITSTLSITEMFNKMLLQEPMLIEDEDMDYYGIINLIEVDRSDSIKGSSIIISVDILIRVSPEPELKLCSVRIKRDYPKA
jgi:hypothetical protein